MASSPHNSRYIHNTGEGIRNDITYLPSCTEKIYAKALIKIQSQNLRNIFWSHCHAIGVVWEAVIVVAACNCIIPFGQLLRIIPF